MVFGTQGMDWWALGITLFELRVGVTPFELLQKSGQGNHIFYLIMRRDPHFPKWLSEKEPALASLLKQLLTKDYAKRLGSGPAGAEEIKGHPFFGDVDWPAVAAGGSASAEWAAPEGFGGQTAAEQLAAVTESTLETTPAAVAATHAAGKVSAKEQKRFADFSGYWDEDGAADEGGGGAAEEEKCIVM